MATQNPSDNKVKWSLWHTLLILIIIIGTPLLVRWMLAPNPLLFDGETAIAPGGRLLWIWWTWVLGLLLFATVAGGGITGSWPFGWLINEQYRMSLSRLQMCLWTIVVLASFATAVAMNLVNQHPQEALAVAIPADMWLLLGISTTSLVASPLILADKKKQTTNTDERKRTLASTDMRFADAQAVPDAEVAERSSGQLARNASPAEASFADLLRGEQVGNCDVVDVARLQNLFFTLILVVVYALALLESFEQQMTGGGVISAFPDVDAAFAALLGISTTGYLAAKGVNYQAPQPGN